MSIYSAKYRLASCKVNVKMLKEIEKYILFEAEAYLLKGNKTKDITGYETISKEMFHVNIEGKDDSVRYSSTEEYKGKRLPDGTKSVTLEFSSMVDKFFHLKVIFHSSISEHPVLEIAMADRNAKEECKPIAAGIIRIVKEHRNTNYLFHNRFVQIGLLFLYTFYNIYTFLNLTGYIETDPSALSLAYFIIFSNSFGLFILWYIVSIFMRRYTTFDTGRQKIINISYYIITALFVLVIGYYLYHVYSMMYSPHISHIKL